MSSRGSQDSGRLFDNYYGYIGSHGLRYSNYIFSEADLVIALGNRMAFPLNSESYKKALENKDFYNRLFENYSIDYTIT